MENIFNIFTYYYIIEKPLILERRKPEDAV